MTLRQFWSILRGRHTNYRFLNMSWTAKDYDQRVLEMSKAELLAECARVGIDPEQAVADVDAAAAQAIKTAALSTTVSPTDERSK